MSICSQEVSTISLSNKSYSSVTEGSDNRPTSPVPFEKAHIKQVKQRVSKQSNNDVVNIATKPHEIKSLLPDASLVRPISPLSVVVFPPEIPDTLPPRSRSSTPRGKQKEIKPAVDTTKVKDEKVYSQSEVENIVKNEVNKALSGKETFSLKDLPKPIIQSGSMAKALSTASDRPFTPKLDIKERALVPTGPIGLPPETVPYFPPTTSATHRHCQCKSPMTAALTTASSRPYSPLPHATQSAATCMTTSFTNSVAALPPVSEPYFPPAGPSPEGTPDRVAQALREVGCKSPMTEALTIAPARSFSPLPPSQEEHKLASKVTNVMSTSSKTTNAASTTSSTESKMFQPIMESRPVRKPISMLNALTVAPEVPFTVPGKTPIPTENLPIPGQSAFKPVSPTSPTFVPVTTFLPGHPGIPSPKPTKYYPMYTRVPQPSPPPQVEHGTFVDKNHVDYSTTSKRPKSPRSRSTTTTTSTKTTDKSESLKVTSSTKETEKKLLPHYQQNIGYIRHVESPDHRSVSPVPPLLTAPVYTPPPEVLYPPPCVKQMKETVKHGSSKKFDSIEPVKERPPSGPHLKPPNILPYYQQNINEIPARNKSISPAPHPIRAPSAETRPMSPSPINQEHYLKPPNLLPYYQQNIGEIPVRNKSISPVPHLIRAPSLEPRTPSPSPVRQHGRDAQYCYASDKTIPSFGYKPQPQSKGIQPKKPATQTVKEITKESLSKETKSLSKKDKEVRKSVTKITKEVRPESPSTWKAKVEKTVQNLSPLTVRIVSPVPKPTGIIEDSIRSSIHIKHHGVQGRNTEVTVSEVYDPPPSPILSKPPPISTSPAPNKLHSNIPKHSTRHTNNKNTLTGKLTTAADNQIKYNAVNKTTLSKTLTNTISNKTKSESLIKSIGKQTIVKNSCNNSAIETFGKQTNNVGITKNKSDRIENGGITKGSGIPPQCGVGSFGGGGGAGGAGGRGATAGTSAPRRGRGVLNPNVGPSARIPLCGQCNRQIRGPFITALGKIWCPEHFICVNTECRRQLQDIGFVEESEGLYCEFCFEKYLAPTCSKCNVKIKGDCLNAIGKQFHPECFTCTYCNKMFGNNPFFLEDSLPYCENDWNELFTTKCFSCGFPIEAGDRWVEALSNNYHSQCFNCTMCKKNLEGQSFFAKGGRPFCKNHAR